MGNKFGDVRWKWLAERGFNVLADRHQYAYMQSLWSPPELVQAVFCEAKAGTGKTVLATLAGAYAVENEEYDRIIYVRNPIPVGKDIGALPGELKDKVAPFMAPFVDALEYVRPGTFGFWSDVTPPKSIATTPTFTRGITWERSFVILDEVQSWSLEELQTVYTRIADSCKVVTIGSLRQIDGRLKMIAGRTPFEVYMHHFDNQRVTFHKLETNYRGWFSNHADDVQDTVNKLRQGGD